jgi:DedD protein
MFKVGNMQRETAGDVELNLKKRARRRLVGAIALVLLMVIVLPMILKDRAATAPQEQVTITLPSEQTAPAVSDFDSSIVPTDPPITLTPEVAEPEAESTAIADPEAAPAKEAPAKEPVVAKPATEKLTSGKFYVQIGVFSDAANVKQLQTKLSDLGYKSQTEKISTDKGQKIRLKTQIFGDRNEAAIALENIKDAGLTGMVVSQ